jgi:diguanylate cyclase (GGDEF)-like protein
LGSFKLRLVTYFLLLALLPLLAASWAFSEVATKSEVSNTDSRLNAALRVAINDYSRRVGDLELTARSLANATTVQEAFQTRNRSALVRQAKLVPGTAFYANGQLLAGEAPAGVHAERTSVVSSEGVVIGKIVVWFPLDDTLLAQLRAAAGLTPSDRILLARSGEVFAGPSDIVREKIAPLPESSYTNLGESRYRAVSALIMQSSPPLTLVVVTPEATIDGAVSSLRERFLLFAFLALAIVAILAWLLGRTIVRSLGELAEAGRDELATLGRAFNEMSGQLAAERGRVQDAVDRFGKALAATHDPYTLLNVIVESAVEATGAAGGRLVVDGEEQARAGSPEEGGKPLVIPLGPEGREDAMLLLTPAGADFGDQSRELALWLGSQASIALENVRLHRLVARQASTDGLTELANRREFEDSLANEISRAERFGGTLALILADLDNFKQVNDRFGHQAGDEVLRSFADILRETMRDIDVAARYGGEEFAILLPQTDIGGAEALAERLREAVEARAMAEVADGPVTVTSSFGVASFPEASTGLGLFAAADEALYRAKRAGKNCVVCAETNGPVRAPH